jgi:autotransporter translocation and assembly factor TamB
MILRIFSKILQLIVICIVVLLLLCCILFAILQTKWAKEQIREQILSAINAFGFPVSAEELSGQPPFTWTLKSIHLNLSENQELKLSQIKLRIAILPLIRGKIAINYLKVENAEYSFDFPTDTTSPFSLEQSKALLREQIETLRLPCSIAIQNLNIDHFTLLNKANNSSFSFGLHGKAMIGKQKDEFALDLNFLSADRTTTYLELELAGSKARNFIETAIKLHLDAFPSSFFYDVDGKIAANLDLKGTWVTWNEILDDLPPTSHPLSGSVKGVIADTQIPNLPILNRKWKFKAHFSIASSQGAFFKDFVIASDLVQIKGKGQLLKEIDKSQGMIAFTFPDLSLFSSPLLKLTGQIDGKALYQASDFKASWKTRDLHINQFSLMTMQGLIKAIQKNQSWEGEAKLSSENAQIPFESSFAFQYLPEVKFSLNDFSLTIPDGNASGNLSYDISRQLFDSNLFANLQHLDRFSPVLNKDNLDGNFAIELQLSSFGDQQDAKCVILGKDLRYQDLLLDDVTISTEVQNLFDHPQGRFSLLAEKFYSPNIYLSRLNFGTSSDEENWPFFVDVEGRIENPFHCYAKGFWKKENLLFNLELTQLFGDLSQIPFALKHPAELEWGTESLDLSPFELRIGEGSLYTRFELSPVRSLAKWDVTHFPLEILSCLKPRFALKGFVTGTGFFDASSENIEGTLNMALEEADILHFGKKQPFQAKGTLQAHLNQKRVQIYTDLHAINEQFFDCQASLPVNYRLYPFAIALDETKQTSAELIAEGKLEDLFDFVNLGTNSFTGLVSCRLFLSQTLASPSLQGALEWQDGTFENYFTGITLKEIDAKFQAQDDAVHLLELHASDDKKGAIQAEGKLLLKPNEYFPYAFEAEMTQLHALGFDMIDCNLSGPLYLTGNMKNMFAQGNLLIDEAMIQITERLPYEVPSLPVTYINRPPHLYTKTIASGPAFTFHMDLDVTAEDKVYVEGRGLKAELQGNVHLRGKDNNIAANGSLKLIKGEYQFSGKVFKLTEGEILFNDKPAPSAYINLDGILSLPDITITAMLRGPLISPQLTFQSNPQKPTSEILSLILFNKDIAEISHTEAIQLASTLVSLSGGAGPDVLDSIRKSIGIDRLNIASRKGSKEGSDEIALEIGKYLTRGIMITLSQSPTSSQVIVEVELPHGFVFQAETQEEEEGKFSLKWRKSY